MNFCAAILFIALAIILAYVAGRDSGRVAGHRAGYELGCKDGWDSRREATQAVLEATRKNLNGIRMKVWNLFGAMMDAMEEKPNEPS